MARLTLTVDARSKTVNKMLELVDTQTALAMYRIGVQLYWGYTAGGADNAGIPVFCRS